jgi:hypothetical protein
MLPGILMSDNDRSFAMQPLVSVSVIEMPVRIDQMPNRIGAESRQRFGDPWARDGNSGVDQNLSVASGEDGDVPARTLQHADVSAQPMNLDGRGSRCGSDALNNSTRLGEDLPRGEPAACRRDCRRADAAQTKTAPREQGSTWDIHDVLLSSAGYGLRSCRYREAGA